MDEPYSMILSSSKSNGIIFLDVFIDIVSKTDVFMNPSQFYEAGLECSRIPNPTYGSL